MRELWLTLVCGLYEGNEISMEAFIDPVVFFLFRLYSVFFFGRKDLA